MCLVHMMHASIIYRSVGNYLNYYLFVKRTSPPDILIRAYEQSLELVF